MQFQPDCLRTSAQVREKFGGPDARCRDADYAIEHPARCVPPKAERCYRGSPAAVPALNVAAALACLLALAAALL